MSTIGLSPGRLTQPDWFVTDNEENEIRFSSGTWPHSNWTSQSAPWVSCSSHLSYPHEVCLPPRRTPAVERRQFVFAFQGPWRFWRVREPSRYTSYFSPGKGSTSLIWRKTQSPIFGQHGPNATRGQTCTTSSFWNTSFKSSPFTSETEKSQCWPDFWRCLSCLLQSTASSSNWRKTQWYWHGIGA